MPLRICVLAVGLLLTGCSQPAAQARGGGGTIDAINHTKWAINHFSVDRQWGIDIIGPFQGGGGGCCYSAPARWTPGMTVRIDWESGEASTDDFPGYENWNKYLEWEKKSKPATASTAKLSRCLTITARIPAALRCIFCPVMR
ncbi:Protein of uncharacterised function (DUF3304) [Serratia liquefaciens]|nr:Protein of uncharacterised function (DUF3304) [Serratia liquefaciens]